VLVDGLGLVSEKDRWHCIGSRCTTEDWRQALGIALNRQFIVSSLPFKK
jgi:hypothetical protein